MLYLLGMVFLQIVIESLPISSSGNCALWMHLLELYTTIKTCMVPIDIDFLLHGPTILVVGLYFLDVIVWYILHISLSYKKLFQCMLASLIAGVITSVGYLLIRHYHLVTLPLSVGFLITAVLLFSLQWCTRAPKKYVLTLADGALLGLVQACALLPGISRFASTYVATRWLGFPNYHAFGYSFAIQLPLLGAAFLKGLYGVYTGHVPLDFFTFPLYMCVFVSTLISYLVFKWVGKVVVADQVKYFGWYVLGTAVVAYIYGL